MNCTVISANNFSALSWIISRISPVQSAVSVRKSTLYRPFIFPILRQRFDLADSEKFGLCIGIGFGELLDSGHEGLYGPEMNLASKLGEDTAEAGEILLTEAAWTDLPADTQKLFRRRSVAISGADIAYHAMRAP